MTLPAERRPVNGPDDTEPPSNDPTISCRRCGREWDLGEELDAVGNQAFEQFALDHRHHTGHFPDGVATWRVECRHCPETVERIEEGGAKRWAHTHVRHTNHAVTIHGTDGTERVLEP
ncbi:MULTISPECIES: hypothetical protein [Halomicrobium]|uniref:Uncharacterized protein n=2 Tax=Halomicrobium mukohataei TaxID=57705 RepID=C7NWI8_HALMD|nr:MULTISPECIES: hypothetical protein [Halomicrobium]ACV46329.1 conserved hypothetical protein [Halomicrobium mukohataei DSM 12286]QCD64885.1 hypothetical protein E5139_04255 [Halomicrobium mukohataei]QFR19691.1 hypothetical protein GBQ70_04250 [Halomicrobium sp. ZPS1]